MSKNVNNDVSKDSPIDGAAVELVNGAVVGVEPVDGVTPDCEGL